jgi:cell division protein FtsI (penicillin-binding protein 3)
MSTTELKKGRLTFVYLLILFAFLIIIARMIFLVSFGDKVKIRGIYDNSKLHRRGDIYDRNDSLVASDLKTKSLYVSSILIKDDKAIAAGISRIFSDLSYDEVLHKIISGKRRRDWILIKRNITPNQEQEVNNLKKAGLIFENDSIRVYPQRSILSHLVGYVDLDRKGLSGIERYYNETLFKDDKKVQIAADIRVQDILQDELLNGIAEFKAKAASGIIMDVTNGEVIALSSLPSFDPNLQADADRNERFNRATNGVYELGSIFKIFTNAIAFDNNLVKMNDKFSVSEPIKYGRFTINDDHPEKGEISVADIFAKSSNIGTVKIAQKIGIDTQKEYMKKFGFLGKIKTDFGELGKPIFPRTWREINLFTISYGHGIAVTPLHIAAAASAVVNGGILYQPSFIKINGEVDGKRILSENTSKLMREMLRKVAVEGTGRNANVEGYEVGGKTGTAEKVESGKYSEKQTIASFLGVFPMSDPKYLVYVVFDQPNYTFNTGGMVAAPVAGRVIKNIAPILGVLPR